MRMNKTATVEEFEQVAREKGFSIAQICREANVNQATFQRWKGGSNPTLTTYNALIQAVETLSRNKTESAAQ